MNIVTAFTILITSNGRQRAEPQPENVASFLINRGSLRKYFYLDASQMDASQMPQRCLTDASPFTITHYSGMRPTWRPKTWFGNMLMRSMVHSIGAQDIYSITMTMIQK